MALETGKVATDLLISGVAKSNEPAMIVPNSPHGRPVREKSKDKDDDLEGLPADVAEVNALQAQFMADGNITIQEEITLKRRIAALKPRLDTWKKARDVVEKNNASGEYAIDDSGFAYLINDKGDIEKKHVNAINQYDKGRILTYGKLLDATFNKYAFDDDMLNAVGNAVTASMAQKKLIDLITQNDKDSASATSGSGGVTSSLNGWITKNKKSHTKWSAISPDREKEIFSTLVRNMDAKDRYALILKGRLNYNENEALDNNEEAAVFESLMGWTGRSIEKESIENVHYTSIGIASSGKKDGKDDDVSGLITSSKIALDVLSKNKSDLESADYNFGKNGKFTLKVANATPTYNSSVTSSVTCNTLDQLLNFRGSMATDKMSFYLNDDIYIGNQNIDTRQYKTIQIDGNKMKTTFIPFRRENGEGKLKPDIELLNFVANGISEICKTQRLQLNDKIDNGNINLIASKFDNYFKTKDNGKYSKVRIIHADDPDDKEEVLDNTVEDVINSYFERNYLKDFKDAKLHPCDICYATFSIGDNAKDKTFTFSEAKVEDPNTMGLNKISYLVEDKNDQNGIIFDYNNNINLAYRESQKNENASLASVDDADDIGRGLLILPHKTGEWIRAFSVDLPQLEKSKRTKGMLESDKTQNQKGYEKEIYEKTKGGNQYTPPLVK